MFHIRLFGGYEHAERQIAAFLPDALSYNYDFPVVSLKIRPLQKKFAEDLSHRDYLGALLNLGVDRSKIGDILVGEKEAIFFCEEGIAPFLQQELTRVRHTPVLVEAAAPDEIQVTERHGTPVRGTVSTVRSGQRYVCGSESHPEAVWFPSLKKERSSSTADW